ncbi:hypothetical protein BGW38_006310, partial [Lunasporangiospora selenospora]
MDSPRPSDSRSPTALDSNAPSLANSEENTPTGTPLHQHSNSSSSMPGGQANGPFSPLDASSIKKPDSDDSLEQRVADDPYDAESWQTLLDDAEKEGDVPKVRELYEKFLKIFPTS